MCSVGEYQPLAGADACKRCEVGQDSLDGSAACTFCASGYYRPRADSPAVECRPCSTLRGITCGPNSTVATLELEEGYWRHSIIATRTYRCKADGAWTPCIGGANASDKGDGYCADGYRGPRCEVCDGPAYSKHFDTLSASCKDCGNVTTRTVIVACSVLLVLLAGFGLAAMIRRLDGAATMLRGIRKAQVLWRAAGMRYKIKSLVGFYQCVSAVPSVYNVVPPVGLEEYTRWIDLLELPSELENIFIASACLGDYQERVLLGSFWPILVILALAAGFTGWEVWQGCQLQSGRSSLRPACAVAKAGLQHVLPLALGLTFLVLPSTSTRIFRTFSCERIEYGDDEMRRYLAADLALSCDTDDYEATYNTAIATLFVWPVAMPLFYAVLLWASRDAFRTGISTPLSEATAYLSADYHLATFWWEPLEMCRKLTVTGWVLLIRADAEQARVVVALCVSITFFGLNLRFQPLRRVDNGSLATLCHLALILLYLCVLAIKTCNLSPGVCSSFGFGDSAKGFFLFFLFFSLSMLAFQVIFEAAAVAYQIRQWKKLRRLRYRGGGFVELLPVAEKEFAHLPGLQPSPCFHLFLSHAWPLGQDVCKLIKQRCREICPSLRAFLDVEDLNSGYGAESVDSSQHILVFAMPVYFEKINCVRELVRAIVRDKPITLLLPDAEVHGEFTQAMIGEIVTGEWLEQWRLGKLLAEWTAEWGVAELAAPTAAEMCGALLQQPPLEWSRITPFQDRTMVLMCQRLLPEVKHNIYLQGATNFKLPRGHITVTLYCSPHNPGARELAEELNGAWPGLLQVAEIHSWADLRACDHMLVYLNASTWTHEAEEFAGEIREAMRVGLHLQLCHEFPSVLDVASARGALEFKSIMHATPSDLKTNLYSQIAIPIKGGALREVGLASLAERVAQRSKTTDGGASVRAIGLGKAMAGLLSRVGTLDSSNARTLGLGVSTVQPGPSASSPREPAAVTGPAVDSSV